MVSSRWGATGFAIVLGAACSSPDRDDDMGSSVPTLGSSDETGEPSSGGSDTTGGESSGAPACEDTCEAGVCIGGVCCDPDSACGQSCCGGDEVCSFQACVVPGDTCIDASECPQGHYCEYSLGEPADEDQPDMCAGGASLATGKCLPEPPECEEGVDPGDEDELDCLPKCEYHPPTSFAPELKYAWGTADVMMTPIVVQLDDDNCDDVVDERDIPEILFTSFQGGNYNDFGTLHAISIVDGEVVDKWSVTPAGDRIAPWGQLAGGNIDGLPGNEVLACRLSGAITAYRGDGSELWTSSYAGGCYIPSIVDLDGDGSPEVIATAGVLDGKTGSLEVSFPATSEVTVADLDGNGIPDLVGATAAYKSDGSALAQTTLAAGSPAIADFDLDGKPEVVAVHSGSHQLHVWRYDPQAQGGFEIVRQGVDFHGPYHGPSICGHDVGGGPPVVADFNGDGTPDVGVAGAVGYAVLDGAKLMDGQVANADTLMWIQPTHDCSSAATGSSVFDFDGDGSAEVVYSDEYYLRIYDGSDGEVLFETCNTTGTLVEYPVIADVDNDGHADIVAVSNAYAWTCPATNIAQRGVRVFGDQNGLWVRTRRVWNQHNYHVTNVEEDGSIPPVESPNWVQDRLNNFRQNMQPAGEFAAPDLVAKVLVHCEPEEYGVVARVRNIGQAAVPADVPVSFYRGDPSAGGELLGTLATTKVLYPAEAEDVVLMLANPPADLKSGATEAWVVLDDTGDAHPWHECRLDNNDASALVECTPEG